ASGGARPDGDGDRLRPDGFGGDLSPSGGGDVRTARGVFCRGGRGDRRRDGRPRAGVPSGGRASFSTGPSRPGGAGGGVRPRRGARPDGRGVANSTPPPGPFGPGGAGGAGPGRGSPLRAARSG